MIQPNIHSCFPYFCVFTWLPWLVTFWSSWQLCQMLAFIPPCIISLSIYPWLISVFYYCSHNAFRHPDRNFYYIFQKLHDANGPVYLFFSDGSINSLYYVLWPFCGHLPSFVLLIHYESRIVCFTGGQLLNFAILSAQIHTILLIQLSFYEDKKFLSFSVKLVHC